MDIGNQMKAKREELDRTQREMGKTLGIGTQQYNRIENNYSTPSFKVLQKFADLFGTIIRIFPRKS